MMKAMKRTVSILLILAALLGLLPTTAFAADVIASGYCGGEGDGTNLTWTLDSSGTLTISGKGAMMDYWPTNPNKTWMGYYSYVKTVTITHGVTTIGRRAFCHIERGFPLVSITIPNSIETIGEEAFRNCRDLPSVVIPESVTTIGSGAFYHCSQLASITVNAGNSTYCDIDGVLFNKSKTVLVCYPVGKSNTSYTVPNSVTTISDGAFFYCRDLKTVTIPEGIEMVCHGAFYGCSNLASITMPASVTSIGSTVFGECLRLESIAVSAKNSSYCDIDGVLFNKAKTELIRFPALKNCSTYIIPNSVSTICIDAFSSNHNIESITIPDTVTTIMDRAFLDCYDLRSVYFQGNAPAVRAINAIGSSNSFEATATLYYKPGTTGWTDSDAYDAAAGTWNGYKLATWNGVPGSSASAGITARYPAHEAAVQEEQIDIQGLQLQFSSNVKSTRKPGYADLDFTKEPFSIYRASDDKLLYRAEEARNDALGISGIDYSIAASASGKQGIIHIKPNNFPLLFEKGERYYVTMGAGFVELEGDAVSPEIKKGDWVFTVSGYKTGTFAYRSNFGEAKHPYTYSDTWLSGTTTAYNHDLAKISLRVAMAAYDSVRVSKFMEDELGFSRLTVKYPDPQRDTIGYAIGKRTLPATETDKEKTIILVAVRGGNYGAEWAGNFEVGSRTLGDAFAGDLHEGFLKAAQQVETGLKTYLRENDAWIADDCVIWITGYSRAAATANMLAKRLDDGSIPGFGTQNVYAYCFECPQNSRASNLTNARYDNIMSIVNPLDFVPMVVMDKWNYGRYGQTFYLPYEEGVANYDDLKFEMLLQYISIMQASAKPGDAFAATEQVAGQRDMTIGAMNWLADEFNSPQVYASLYQEALMQCIEAFSHNDWRYVSAGSALTLLTKLGLIAVGAVSLPKDPAALVDKALGMEDDLQAIMAMELMLVGMLDRGSFLETHLTYAHYPELCLAWMDSLSGSEIVKIDSTYRKVLVNCPVDVAIYDSNGILVGKVVNRVVQDIENGVSVYIDEDEQIVVSLPSDQEYRLDITATDSGTVTYTVTEQNLDTSSSDRVVCYPGVAIETGDRLSGTVEDLDTVAVATYSLSQGQQRLKPAVDQTGAAVQEYTVTVTVEGAGSVSGGGSGVYGEFKKLSATPDSGTKFVGWYLDGVLLSNDPEYRVCITKDMELVAKFGEGEQTDFIDVSPSDWFYADVAYVSGKGLMNGTGNGRFSPQESTSRAMIVTILYRMSGEPKVSGGSGFTDVPEGQWYSSAVAWAAEHNIVNGYGNGKFGPNDSITREQLAAILYRYAQFCGRDVTAAADLSGFTDAPQISAWAKTALAWANAEGLINGRTETTVVPAATASRAELAAILHRFCEKIR